MEALGTFLLAWLPAALLVVAGTALGFWLRRWLRGRLTRWAKRTPWRFDEVLVSAMRWPLPMLALLVGLEAGLRLAPLTAAHREVVHRAAVPLFVIVVTWMVADGAQGLIKAYAKRIEDGPRIAPLVQQIVLVVIAGTGCLYLLPALGVSPTPILVVVGVAAGVGALAVRNVLPDLFAGIGLATGVAIRRGDRIRVGGVEGVVTQIGWRTTTLRSERGDITIIPNNRIIVATVVKRMTGSKIDGELIAPRALELKTRFTLPELTGRRAHDLRELADELERASLACIHQHSLVFVSEHDYLAPSPVSDFARFVGDVLRQPVLRERLDALDPCALGSLEEYRGRLVALCREYLEAYGDGAPAPEGEELFLKQSRVFVLSTGLVAHNLRELAEALRTVPPETLMLHLFEARLGMGMPADNLSKWIEDSYGDKELAGAIAALDPYTSTAEALRNAAIALLEERMRV